MADDDNLFPIPELPEFDPLTAPLAMPREVKRVTPEGFPTTAQLDWEQAFKNWTVDQTVKLNTKITTVRDATDNAFAEVTEEIVTLADEQSALASSVTSLTTTVGGHTSSISSIMTSVNGLGAQWAVVANIGGSYGGLVFSGIKKADGSGATYLLEIQSNVVINGNLTVNGTISNPKLTNAAATQIATASGDSTATVSVNYRGTGKISVMAYYAGTPGVDRGAVPSLTVSMDGSPIESIQDNYYVWVPSSGPAVIRLLQTTILTEVTPSAGSHSFTVTNGVGGGVRIWAFEGSK